jgi:hypothetical protein
VLVLERKHVPLLLLRLSWAKKEIPGSHSISKKFEDVERVGLANAENQQLPRLAFL